MVQAEKKVLRKERTQRKLVREQSLKAVQTTGLKKLTHTVSVSVEDVNTAPRTTGKNDFGDDVNASSRPSIFNKEAEVDSVSSDESAVDNDKAFERLRSKNLIPDPNDVASDDDEVIDQEMAMVQAEKKVLRKERTQRKLVREQSLKAVQTTGLKKLTHTVPVSAEDVNTAPRTTGKNDFGDDVNASSRPSIFNKEAEVDSVSSDESAVDNDKAFERLRSKNLIPDPNDVASDDDEVIDRGVAMVQAEKKVLRKERTQRKLVREQYNYNLSMTT
jgi:hypothetical protein